MSILAINQKDQKDSNYLDNYATCTNLNIWCIFISIQSFAFE